MRSCIRLRAHAHALTLTHTQTRETFRGLVAHVAHVAQRFGIAQQSLRHMRSVYWRRCGAFSGADSPPRLSLDVA